MSEVSTDKTHDPSWEDPAPHIQGVSLSDAIAYYIEVAKLIESHDPTSIKPASYALRLGSRYYCDGKFGDLEEGKTLVLPSNSLTYVSMLEKINMPLYMIARFNLKIDLIYQGILLGTGPQVDPGFIGHLSCPLHNISNNDVELRHGDRFATIDFIKTSPFPSSKSLPALGGHTRQQLYEAYNKEGIPGLLGKKCVLFPSEKLERKTLDNYIPSGRSFVSSLKNFEQTVRLNQNINIGLGIALITLLVTLAIGGTSLWWNQFEYFKTLRDTLDGQITKNTMLIESRDRIEQRIKELELRLSKVETETTNRKSSKNAKQSKASSPLTNN